MPRSACLYFHSPCFDGIVSCVIAWDFLESTQGWKLKQFRPVNYDRRKNWLSSRLHTPSAVVDFLYHPQAQFWADHHLTTFVSEEARRHFERRKAPWLFYSDRAGSCALLLWNRLADSFGFRNSRYEKMVEWADRIDSAQYASVGEAILGEEPALQIRASLSLQNDYDYCERLVRELRHRTLEEVAQLPEVKARSEQVRLMIEAGLERFRKGARLEGEIVVFDVDGADVIVSRYAPYYFFPRARYSLGIVRSADGAKITAMRNPWRDYPSVFLGRIFERFGGGGHRRVGALLLPGDRAVEAGQILERLLDEIRKEETVAV